MQISMAVPYDEQRMRRTLMFILRPQLNTIRLVGLDDDWVTVTYPSP
jgi:hypothetical protein